MVYLEGSVPYAIRAVEPASILMTVVLRPDQPSGLSEILPL
jgi:hypothetical protein